MPHGRSQVAGNATEHLDILLRPEDIRSSTRVIQDDLEHSARIAHWTIYHAEPKVQAGHRQNLEGKFPWRSYLACNISAIQIIGTGITGAQSEVSNDDQSILEFVFYRSDGTYCRVHPGIQNLFDAYVLL